jgi:hypothetical protein
MTDWTPEEKQVLKKLSTPAKIQDFVNSLRYRVQGKNEVMHSPRVVIQKREAQCIEGAMFAAAALRFHGFKPLIVDLEATPNDYDHVIAVFQIDHCWGAISKTNHGVLRYREPVYKSIRELAMSYFHEYFLQTTRAKTMRTFSKPVNLTRFDKQNWETTNSNIIFIADYLCEVVHTPILTRGQINRLRKADIIEARMGKLTEWSE